MKLNKSTLALVSLFSAASFSAPSLAFNEGDIIVRAGVTSVVPQEQSDALGLDGSVSTLSGVLGGEAGLSVDNNTQLGLTAEYMLSSNLGIELLAASPFEHTATATGSLAGLDVADVKQLPPTLSAVYHLDVSEQLQPYVGIGINYTVFFEEDVTDEADAAFTGLGLTGAEVTLEDSVGLAVQIGADYHLNKNVLMNLSVRWIDIETEAEVEFDSGNKISADVTIDPIVYTFALGYKF